MHCQSCNRHVHNYHASPFPAIFPQLHSNTPAPATAQQDSIGKEECNEFYESMTCLDQMTVNGHHVTAVIDSGASYPFIWTLLLLTYQSNILGHDFMHKSGMDIIDIPIDYPEKPLSHSKDHELPDININVWCKLSSNTSASIFLMAIRNRLYQ
ncbi:hypothetical protein QOT17_024576 [Balamuthia mandrillaris]